VPTNTVELPEDQQKDVLALIERLEEDDDVAAVYHNMA
jgi:transcriptional/translational regulatory protein YebC/TACO1